MRLCFAPGSAPRKPNLKPWNLGVFFWEGWDGDYRLGHWLGMAEAKFVNTRSSYGQREQEQREKAVEE